MPAGRRCPRTSRRRSKRRGSAIRSPPTRRPLTVSRASAFCFTRRLPAPLRWCASRSSPVPPATKRMFSAIRCADLRGLESDRCHGRQRDQPGGRPTRASPLGDAERRGCRSARTPAAEERGDVRRHVALIVSFSGRISMPDGGFDPVRLRPRSSGSITWWRRATCRSRSTASVVAGPAPGPVLGARLVELGALSFDLAAPGGEYSTMNVFARLGYDVWTMDHEGYGRSMRTAGNSDIASGVEDLKAASDRGRPRNRPEQDAISRQILGRVPRRRLCHGAAGAGRPAGPRRLHLYRARIRRPWQSAPSSSNITAPTTAGCATAR